MKYLEWNNLIGKYLFDEQMAGKQVYLFLTQQDIILAGRAGGNFEGEKDEFVLSDFISSIRNGIPGEPTKADYLSKLEFAFSKTKILKIDGVDILFPAYLGYLILTVLPVLEAATNQLEDTFRANTYYPRIRDFLQGNRLPKLPYQNQSRNWNHIWEHLSDWSINIKKTDLGIFQVRNFSAGWKYVGIPLSQCLIEPKALKKLPETFLKEGLIPNSIITDNEFRILLEKTWVKFLGQRPGILEYIKREDDDMGRIVLDIVKQVYQNWRGETEVEEKSPYIAYTKRTKKESSRARLFQSFRLDKNTAEFKWGCRMYSQNDYPEDLSFNDLPVCELRENWSNQLEIGFWEKVSLKDTVNKWEAVLPGKDIRFFIGGANLNLNSDYWVEVDQLSRISEMYLLCKIYRSESIENWGKHFQSPGYFKKLDDNNFDGIPDGWSLYKFQFPLMSIDGEPAIQLPTAKKILLTGGVKIGSRTYQKGCLPEVLIENSDSNEEVFLEASNVKIRLPKKSAGDNRWLLPEILHAGEEYCISIVEEKTIPFRIAGETLDALQLDNSFSPKRNPFGMVDEKITGSFVQGSIVQGFDFTRQLIYKHHFQPGQKSAQTVKHLAADFNPLNDLLLEFLTRKKISHSGEFFEAFEQILYRKIPGELEGLKINLTMLKRHVLNLYDFLGYIDFDYQSKRIAANPPQLFLVPTLSGRKALLTGGRTPGFTEKVFEKAKQLGLFISVIPQAGAIEPWVLMPDTLFVEARNLPGYGMEELRAFARELKIYFDPEHIAQWGLLNFSAGIEDYVNSLHADDRFEDYDWSRKIFNPNTFRFERVENEKFDKTFSLVEYQFNAYTYSHILWKEGIAYPVDKSWGRWLVLKHQNRHAVFVDLNGLTAIPAGMPLPRLMSEALLLCSGTIPEQKYMEIDGVQTIFSVYGNVVKIMLDNEFSKIGQIPIQVNQNF